jgi:hypothetical protein
MNKLLEAVTFASQLHPSPLTTTTHCRSGSMTYGPDVGGLAYGFSSIQGRRKQMEDAHSAEFVDGGGLTGTAFFAV